MSRARTILVPAATLIAILLVGLLLVYQSTRRRLELERDAAAEIAAEKAFGIGKRVDQLQGVTATLAAVLRQRGSAADFAALATDVLMSYEGVRAVLWAPGGETAAVFPADAAEGSIELERWLPAELDPGRLQMVGPIRLPRVGNTFWAMRSVLGADGEAQLQGWVIATLAVDDLLRQTAIEELLGAGYVYQLALTDAESGRRRVFARASELELENPEEETIPLPDGDSWVLALAPAAGWPSWESRPLPLVLIGLVALLAALWTHDLARQPEQLRRQVATRTQRLSQASQRLALAEAREAWRELDRFARLALLATIRTHDSSANEAAVTETVAGALNEVGVDFQPHEIESGIGRLLERGLLSRDEKGQLRLEQPVLLSLPDRDRPLAEIARDTLKRIGAYRLERRIGGGGMGEVFRAVNVHDDSPAAVKLLYPHTVDDPEQRQRFEREGAIVARLDHPNIVHFLERGEHQGRLYIAMELVEGKTLTDLVRGGPLAPDEAAAILLDVASALAVLHERGVVHRDVKGSNVMRTPGGRSILLDFGLASGVTAETLTESRTVLGSLPYMAPERLTGERGDPSCDVWALGIIAYELLTGHLPWSDCGHFTLVNEILLGELAPFEELRSVAGAPLARVIEAMLRYAPEDRPRTGTQLMDRLLEIRGEVPTLADLPTDVVPRSDPPSPPPASRERSRPPRPAVDDDFPTVPAATLPVSRRPRRQ